MTYVCYSSWSSSQFHVEILCCHHVHLHKYIYIYYYYAEEFQVYKTDLWYSSAVVLMDTMKFTYDCYNFLNNWSTLHYIPIFNISLWGFIKFTMYVSDMEYIFLIWCVTECPMFESFAQLDSSMSFCTYTMTYYVCHLHVLYIWDIYLSINCYWLIPFTTCYYGHFQNITTVYNW